MKLPLNKSACTISFPKRKQKKKNKEDQELQNNNITKTT